MKSAHPFPRDGLPAPAPWHSSQSHLAARPLLPPVAQNLCICEERASTLEHYFASKSFAAACETCSNTYPGKEVRNKTIIRSPVKEFRTQEVFPVVSARRATKQLRFWPHRFQAVHQLQQRYTVAGSQYSYTLDRHERGTTDLQWSGLRCKSNILHKPTAPE
jgi:hypothetical protein